MDGSDGDVTPRLGKAWSGDLDGWLTAMAGYDPDDPKAAPRLQHWSFPTDELLSSYVESLDGRSEDQVRHLLRCFLFPPVTFGADDRILQHALESEGLAGLHRLQSSEYGQRLLKTMASKAQAQPGLRWVLDFLPEFSPPGDHGRKCVHDRAWAVPAGRPAGGAVRCDHVDLGPLPAAARSNAEQALRDISPREFEQLVARLYTEMGYRCELTPSRRDGGRDVIARREQRGRREHRLIECKHYAGAVPVVAARALLGVVSTEHATSGVLVTTGRVRVAARRLAENDSRLDLIDHVSLCQLLHERFGPSWARRLDYYLTWPPREASTESI